MPGEPHPLSHSLSGADIALLGPAFDLSIRASLIENHSPPEILVHGLVTPDDVDHLFEMSATFYHAIDVFANAQLTASTPSSM